MLSAPTLPVWVFRPDWRGVRRSVRGACRHAVVWYGFGQGLLYQDLRFSDVQPIQCVVPAIGGCFLVPNYCFGVVWLFGLLF